MSINQNPYEIKNNDRKFTLKIQRESRSSFFKRINFKDPLAGEKDVPPEIHSIKFTNEGDLFTLSSEQRISDRITRINNKIYVSDLTINLYKDTEIIDDDPKKSIHYQKIKYDFSVDRISGEYTEYQSNVVNGGFFHPSTIESKGVCKKVIKSI